MSQRHFGDLVYKKRKKLGMRQKALAKSARTTQSTISKLESGQSPLNFLQTARVCRALRIQPAKAFKAILA